MFNITSKYFRFFNIKPPASWVAHITRDFLTFHSCSYYSSMITVIFYFLGKKICKFYHVLLARYKPFKEVSKTFLKYFVKFQKTEYDEQQSSIFSKIIILLLECTILLLQLWNNWILFDIVADCFLPTNKCFM